MKKRAKSEPGDKGEEEGGEGMVSEMVADAWGG